MTVDVKLVLSLCTSCVTLVGMWAAGSKQPWAWLVGLGNQTLWLAFIVMFQAWGLLPLTCALVVTYTRNHLRWKREAAGLHPLLSEDSVEVGTGQLADRLDPHRTPAFEMCWCGHPFMVHDVLEREDPPTCCTEGCGCREFSPTSPRTVGRCSNCGEPGVQHPGSPFRCIPGWGLARGDQ